MIDQALQFIINQMNSDSDKPITPNADGSLPVILFNIAQLEGSANAPVNDRVILSVVNIEEEKTLKNLPVTQRKNGSDGKPIIVNIPPPLFLNIFLLFCANYTTGADAYRGSLKKLSEVLGFFQVKNVFHRDDFSELNVMGVEKIIFDLHSLRIEELNQVWSILGSKYIPSAMYKMRMAIIQKGDPSLSGIIDDLETREKPKSNAPKI